MNAIATLTLVLPSLLLMDAPSSARSEQVAKISKLVRDTESRDIQLKAELQHLEQELTDAYAEFELDEERIKEIQEKIAGAQKDLLANYHMLQVGIRTIMGKQEFAKIKARIDYYLKTAEKRRQEPAQPPSGIPVQPR